MGSALYELNRWYESIHFTQKAIKLNEGNAVVSVGQAILFFGSTIVDIYSSSTETWTGENLPVFFSSGTAALATGGNVYALNGSEVLLVQL